LHKLTPQLNFAFDLTKSSEMRGPKLSQQDKEALVERFTQMPKSAKLGTAETWNANILYDPLARVVDQIRKTDPQIIAKVAERDIDRKLSQEFTRLKISDPRHQMQAKQNIMANLQNNLQDPGKSFSQIQQQTNITIQNQFRPPAQAVRSNLTTAPKKIPNPVISASKEIPSRSPKKNISRFTQVTETARRAVANMINKLSNQNKPKKYNNSAGIKTSQIKTEHLQPSDKARQALGNLDAKKTEDLITKSQSLAKSIKNPVKKTQINSSVSIANHRIKNNQKNGRIL
jgi:hypothetical protein